MCAWHSWEKRAAHRGPEGYEGCSGGGATYHRQMVNDTRAAIEKAMEETKKNLEAKAREEQLAREVIDVTLPAKKINVGHRHPNTIALEEVERIFVGMGYEVVEGPEVEYDLYNFEKLNIPANHPAKDEQDTFISPRTFCCVPRLPRTGAYHGTGKAPDPCDLSGQVFRSDEVDATHSPSFHQIEGLVVDKNITFADLKGTLEQFAKELFGPETRTKFRPHHFPFTEPSGRGGRKLLQVRRKRLPVLQGQRLDRDPGLRYGTSPCLGDVRHRSGGIHRICLRRGAGAYRTFEV